MFALALRQDKEDASAKRRFFLVRACMRPNSGSGRQEYVRFLAGFRLISFRFAERKKAYLWIPNAEIGWTTVRHWIFSIARCLCFRTSAAAPTKRGSTASVALEEASGVPHRRFRSVHVAGTNGKGSVSHLIASALSAAGYRTGLFTSPHLKDFRERMRVDGETISEREVVEYVERNRETIGRVQPSFFEITTAMAFDHFARREVDVAVVEVGMGGRLDSTNVIRPLLSVITNIGYDHTQFLGDTLGRIARREGRDHQGRYSGRRRRGVRWRRSSFSSSAPMRCARRSCSPTRRTG